MTTFPTTYCPATGKRSFRNKPEAQRALKLRRRWDKGEIRCYRCSSCKGWHLTSAKQVSKGRRL